MKLTLLPVLACTLAVDAHGIWQKLSVNGAQKGSLEGWRAPGNNNPVQDVNSNSIICGQGGSTSGAVINVNAGDEIGAWFQHVIGGPQGSNDPDNPIAASHKGPVSAYLAKVDNAASSSSSGLKWFKVWQDTYDTGSKKWGVDNLISNSGWAKFRLPTCVAPGQYLLRMEILALHSAYSQGGAQFYNSCAQINVAGSGSSSPSTVSFPGAYKSSDPGITTNIYGTSGLPDNNNQAYAFPGPNPISC